MKRTVDLHTHSTASDGQYAPARLVEMAKEKGIEVLAVTDHDTINGVDEAAAAGVRLGVRVLRGVELSADDYLDLHILGYNISPKSIQIFLDGLQKGRDDRRFRIADFLRGKGIDVDLPAVERRAAKGAIGRPHFAEWMAEQGMVASRKEAFDRYLDTPEFHEIDRGKPSAEACIKAIKEAGGVASFAHPYQVVLGQDSLESLVDKLVSYGLDAIECYYPIHTPEQTAEYLRLTQKYGLHITGGSDFHGEKSKPDHPMAKWELNVEWLLY